MNSRKKLVEFFHKGATSRSNIKAIIGTIFFFLYLALFVIASLLVDNFFRLPKFLPKPLNIIISGPILVIGIFLNLWSVLQFFKAKGTPVPFKPPPKLVTTGPYAHIRHPQGTGWFIIFIGLGLLFQSVSLVFIFTPLFIVISVLHLKKIEEPELEKRFGKEYTEYKKKVPMYIPQLKLRTKNSDKN